MSDERWALICTPDNQFILPSSVLSLQTFASVSCWLPDTLLGGELPVPEPKVKQGSH